MPVYRITDISEGGRSITRHRADAAKLALERMVYDCIAASGGLDTRWGHRLAREARFFDVRNGGDIECDRFTVRVTVSTVRA